MKSLNGKLRTTSRIPLLHKSNEDTKKTVKINFFRIWEISQRLAIIWGVLTQEKWLNLGRKQWATQHCSFFYLNPPLPSSAIVLKTNNSAITVETTTATEGGTRVMRQHYQRTVIIWHAWQFPGNPPRRACLYFDLTQSFTGLNSLFP